MFLERKNAVGFGKADVFAFNPSFSNKLGWVTNFACTQVDLEMYLPETKLICKITLCHNQFTLKSLIVTKETISRCKGSQVSKLLELWTTEETLQLSFGVNSLNQVKEVKRGTTQRCLKVLKQNCKLALVWTLCTKRTKWNYHSEMKALTSDQCEPSEETPPSSNHWKNIAAYFWCEHWERSEERKKSYSEIKLSKVHSTLVWVWPTWAKPTEVQSFSLRKNVALTFCEESAQRWKYWKGISTFSFCCEQWDRLSRVKSEK